MDHADLQKLWQLADEAPRAKGTSPDGVFEATGLILSRPLQRATYATTPANTLAFAWTGGDGVHFSFVLRDGRVADDSPILMSVPASFDAPNVVVGKHLRDFLALGVGRGFFSLEGLVYDAQSFLDGYPASEEELDGHERDLLRLLRSAFAVEPWPDPKARLEELAPPHAVARAPGGATPAGVDAVSRRLLAGAVGPRARSPRGREGRGQRSAHGGEARGDSQASVTVSSRCWRESLVRPCCAVRRRHSFG